jgi:hypothetical protein
MGDMTREELAAMTDQELLAYEREHHGDPYMSLLKAKGMQRAAVQFWHVGAANKKADREAQEEARRRLHQKLFPSDSAVLESNVRCPVRSRNPSAGNRFRSSPRSRVWWCSIWWRFETSTAIRTVRTSLRER